MVNGRGPSPPDDRDWTTRRELPPISRSSGGGGVANGGHAAHPPQQHQQLRSSVRIDAAPIANGVHGVSLRWGFDLWEATQSPQLGAGAGISCQRGAQTCLIDLADSPASERRCYDCQAPTLSQADTRQLLLHELLTSG